jgi:hypothetical protein
MSWAPQLAHLAGSRPLLLRLTNVALAGLRIPAVREALFAAVDAAKEAARQYLGLMLVAQLHPKRRLERHAPDMRMHAR